MRRERRQHCRALLLRQDLAARHDRAGHAWLEKTILPSRDVNRSRKRAGLLTTSTSADVYCEAEPLGGFLF